MDLVLTDATEDASAPKNYEISDDKQSAQTPCLISDQYDRRIIDDDDDPVYGKVRDRRDFGPLDIRLKPILPIPFREFTYRERYGWTYHPRAPFEDRLGQGRLFKADTANQNIRDRKRKATIVGPVEESFSTTQAVLSSLSSSPSSLPLRKRLKMPSPTILSLEPTKTINTASKASSSTTTDVTTTDNNLVQQPLLSSSTSANREVTANTPSLTFPLTISNSNVISSQPHLSTINGGTSSSTPVTNKKDLDRQTSSGMSITTTTPTPTTSFAPKAALYQWYGKKPRLIQLNNTKQYQTWDNGQTQNQQHQQLFTSIFICPLTQELFLSGPWSDTSDPPSQPSQPAPSRQPPSTSASYKLKDGLYWYPRKAWAEHAAAARAYDCLLYREQGGNSINCCSGSSSSTASSTRWLGQGLPYWPSQCPLIPWKSIPQRIMKLLPSESIQGAPIYHNDDNTTTTATTKAPTTTTQPTDGSSLQ